MLPENYVICIRKQLAGTAAPGTPVFEYWVNEKQNLTAKWTDATVYTDREAADKALGYIPRMYEAAVYQLTLAPLASKPAATPRRNTVPVPPDVRASAPVAPDPAAKPKP